MAQLRSLERELSYQPLPLYRDLKKSKAIKLDLNSLCIRRPTETFFIHVQNPHLISWGIEYGDLLIVENHLNPEINDLFVVETDGVYKFYQFFSEIAGEKILFALDTNEQNLRIQDWSEIEVAGVITNVVHQMKNRTSATRYAA